MTTKMRALILAVGLLAFGLSSEPAFAQASRDYALNLGRPTPGGTSRSDYFLENSQYSMSYSDYRRTSNWVAWHLSSAWLGNLSRRESWSADSRLPSNFYRVQHSHYSGSGFSRGHMCPSGDRTRYSQDMAATYLMTNMVPQSEENNSRAWARLEEYCRTLAQQGNELYIVCGPYGSGGTGRYGKMSTINNGNIRVPSYVWKVIVVLRNGTGDAGRVTSQSRVIAVWMPNDRSVGSDWGRYRVSVDYLESKLYYDFLSDVDPNVESIVERKVDDGPTS